MSWAFQRGEDGEEAGSAAADNKSEAPMTAQEVFMD
jgi:hypothetical protein